MLSTLVIRCNSGASQGRQLPASWPHSIYEVCHGQNMSELCSSDMVWVHDRSLQQRQGFAPRRSGNGCAALPELLQNGASDTTSCTNTKTTAKTSKTYTAAATKCSANCPASPASRRVSTPAHKFRCPARSLAWPKLARDVQTLQAID